MRNQLLVGGAMVFATIALIFAGSARAAPPDAMSYQSVDVPVVACDTKDQMAQVIDAIKGGTLKEKLFELAAAKDDKGESVCMYTPLAPVVFGESDHIGRIADHDKTVDAWVVHVGNQHTDFYILWGEIVKDTPA